MSRGSSVRRGSAMIKESGACGEAVRQRTCVFRGSGVHLHVSEGSGVLVAVTFVCMKIHRGSDVYMKGLWE